MTYEVRDCLSDTCIKTYLLKNEADLLCEQKGGHDACIHVFEIAEPVKVVEIKEQKPLSGMLF